MRKANIYARASALPAIAAALALSSTPVGAQQAQPVTTEPAPAVTPTPAPTPTPDVTTTTTSTTVDTSSSPAATETATPASSKTVTTRTVKHTSHVAAAKPAPTTTTVRHVVTSHGATPSAVSTAPAAAPAAAPPATATNRPPPVVDLNAKPAQAPAAKPATTPATSLDTNTMMIGGAVLALLIIGIAAFAIARSRRRRREDQEWADAQTMAYEPFETAAEPTPEPVVHHEQPAIVAPEASAFAWGNEVQHSEPAAEASADDDRRPGESWVERAYRGPSPANPSVSLKARLKRAAFFDKREREVAAGTAEPVDTDAGLPEAMIEEQERELA